MTARPRTLDDLRIELDSIDTQLHELIMRRGALASEIAAIKARDDIERVRPGREAVILRYYQSLSLAEIADALGVPLGTVKSRLHFGLRQLRAVLE